MQILLIFFNLFLNDYFNYIMKKDNSLIYLIKNHNKYIYLIIINNGR